MVALEGCLKSSYGGVDFYGRDPQVGPTKRMPVDLPALRAAWARVEQGDPIYKRQVDLARARDYNALRSVFLERAAFHLDF